MARGEAHSLEERHLGVGLGGGAHSLEAEERVGLGGGAHSLEERHLGVGLIAWRLRRGI